MKMKCSMCGKEIPPLKKNEKVRVCKECLDTVRKKIGLPPGRRIPIKTIEKVIDRMSP
jgi:ribosome-binding protein aMBF1 (putative translation factor)